MGVAHKAEDTDLGRFKQFSDLKIARPAGAGALPPRGKSNFGSQSSQHLHHLSAEQSFYCHGIS